MVYLYAGMGIVMLTGIMGIFEMGLLLTGDSLLQVPIDPYIGSNEKNRDLNMMKSFKFDPLQNQNPIASGLEGIEICNALEGNTYAEKYVGIPTRTFLPKGLDGAWDDGCVLAYGSHQILVVPTPSKDSSDLGPYLIFSCTDYYKASYVCPFVELDP